MSNPLISRFAGELALVEPSQTARFESCLKALTTSEHAPAMLSSVASDDDFWAPTDDSWLARVRPYTVVGGILQIPVKGVLLNNFPYTLYDWATGYEYIWQAFKRGCADFAIGTIKGIAFVCDTPGGMVAGCFDTVDKMVALKQLSSAPVAGFAHESAYSGGYAIISVADRGQVYVSRSGGVGSIGVVTGHLDVSGAMEQQGLKFTYIASDPSKVEGNPYEPLSADALARIQARIDEQYGIFVAAVARSRGLSEAVIRNDLKAYCYSATQAVSNGLADAIGSLEDATTAFAEFLDDDDPDDGDEAMTKEITAVDQAAHEAAVTTARVEGKTEERTRITAILTSDEAKGRTTLANHVAFKTDMSVEDAKAMLAASEKTAAPAAAAPGGVDFTAAMAGTQNPNVGVEASGAQDDPTGSEGVLSIIRAAGLGGFGRSANARR